MQLDIWVISFCKMQINISTSEKKNKSVLQTTSEDVLGPKSKACCCRRVKRSMCALQDLSCPNVLFIGITIGLHADA